MKITEGKGKTLVSMDRLDMQINGLARVSYEQPFFLDVFYYYEEEIVGKSFDEPDVSEYLELLSVKVQSPLYLSNSEGLTMSIDNRCELLVILTEAQIESVIIGLKKQSVGVIHYAEPIRSSAKRYNFDNARLTDDEDIKRKLGFELMENYKR